MLSLLDIGVSMKSRSDEMDLTLRSETDPLLELASHPNVKIIPLSPAPSWLQTSNKLLFLLYGPLKVLLQTWTLWQALSYSTPGCKWMLVQVSICLCSVI